MVDEFLFAFTSLGANHYWNSFTRNDAQQNAQVEIAMKKTTKLRLIGGAVLLFNLWLIRAYNLEGVPVLLLTFGFAVGYEYLVVRPASKTTKTNE